MKRPCSVMAIMIAMIMVLAGGIAGAADVKIGMIDTQKILRDSKAAKSARDVLMKDLDAKKAQYRTREDAVRKLQEELKKDTPSVRQEMAEKLEREIKELGRLDTDLKDEFKKKEAELGRKLLKEISDIVKEFSKKEKYTVILEKRSVVSSDEAIDITDKIIRLYDAVK